MPLWPMAATVSAAFFVVALAALVAAPAIESACGALDAGGACGLGLFAARSLMVGSGAMLASALVWGLYSLLLSHADGPPDDGRPLVSLHARRRH